MRVRRFLVAVLGVGLIGGAWGDVALAQADRPEPPPATAFAREQAIASVDLSPDGRHIVAVISPDGRRRAVAIWQTANLSAAPYLIGSDDQRAEIVAARFIKNDRVFVTTQQLIDFNPFSGAQERTFASRTQVLDLEGNPVRVSLEFDGLNDRQQAFVGIGGLVSELPQDPQNVIVRDPLRGDLYRLNLYNGRAERVDRGSSRYSGQQADLNGEIRARQEFDFDDGAAFIAIELKHPDTGEWSQHFRWYSRDRAPVDVVGFSNDPNIVFVRSVEDRDRSAIYEYDIRARQMGEIAFAHPLFDAGGVIRSTAPADFGEVVAFTYRGERTRTHYIDPALRDGFNQLRRALQIEMTPVTWTDIETGERSRLSVGDGADIAIIAASDDRTKLLVRRSGPEVPPEYWVLIDGRLALLGRAYPELAGVAFGPGELIQYQARDGLIIPAILTRPNPDIFGEGPYPTIVTPHGGPWARDDLDWDSSGWTQYFAARGYAVLQPQFRGSLGWGQRLWRAGDREWGRKMQDDNDDGVRYLVEQGIADPARVAMHGYSYGGYASMMAAVRPNGLYRCAAAGAGPATIALFKKGTYNSRYLREFQHPTADGEDPLVRVNEISIPLYLYTGDRDTIVLPSESETMAAAMRRAGKQVRLTILPDMEHTINTWTPENFAAVLTSVEEFLETDCGMG
jgi:dipeptidyl aminopeptidase/acylaminoacyl peptidase